MNDIYWFFHIVLKHGKISNLLFLKHYQNIILHSSAVGIRCKDGVVFGVEKLVTSKLYEAGTGKRIFTIDRHVGMVNNILFLKFLDTLMQE